jgi:opacity protein-like surface antigen
MKFPKALALAGLALAFGSAPALAADWGGIKDMGGGVAVPVPAPAPVPTFDADSDWYVGLAIGANISQSATITDTDTDYLGDSTPGHFAKGSGNVGASPIFGLTFGRYITPSLRAEIAVDYSPDAQISNDNKLGYVVSNSAPNFVAGVGGIDTNTYSVSRTDTVKLARTTGLFNLLYDIPTGTRFTPYIGGGVGFSWRSLRRSYSESANCISATNSINGDYAPPGSCSGNTSLPPNSSTLSGSSTKQQLDFAAAVQAGVAYNITDQIIWDNGWQMLWEGNSIASVAPSASGENRIVFKDSILQQFRSGLRIKFD